MTQVADVLANRYTIERPIARGGMADVFLALDQQLDRRVAVKVLFPEFARDPSFVERFRREAQNAAMLNHANIVSVYDYGQDHGS
jgi:eukaryotic-like serine/threonine-protein kinase